MSILKYIIGVFDLFLPRNCFECGKYLTNQEYCICYKCLFKMPKTNHFKTPDNEADQLFWGKVRITKAAAYYKFIKGCNTQRAIHALKYHKNHKIGVDLGIQLGYEIKSTLWCEDMDYIIPVPLHPKKKFKRGYNQSYMIAIGIGKITKTPLDTKNLKRKKHTETQTRKTMFSRWQNVKDVFKLDNKEKFINKKILLVDDVLTTGSTLEACAKQFSKIENCSIYISTLAISTDN